MIWIVIFLLGFSSASAAVSGTGAPDDPTRQTDANWIDSRWNQTEVGPFLGGTIDTPRKRTNKGIAVKLGQNSEAAICFDTDLLRYSAGWTGGFLQMDSRRYGLLVPLKPKGPFLFSSEGIPGWSFSTNFTDPRPLKLGPLPKEWAKYQGLYLSGKRVAFAYTVNNSKILDSPWFEKFEDHPVFIRSLEVDPHDKPLTVHLLDLPKGKLAANSLAPKTSLTLSNETAKISVALNGDGDLQMENGSLRVLFPPTKSRIRSTLLISDDQSACENLTKKFSPFPLTELMKPGPLLWTNILETKLISGKETKALTIDTISVPFENPWNALMFTSGHDFLPDGRAVVCTVHGDVWLVSGLNNSTVRWKRFATGLYQPLGLKVVGNNIYVLERDQITVVRDRNGDGEADFYDNFNNDCVSAGGGHSYATCLETDSKGDFYFLKCAEETPHGGSLLRVSKFGQRLERFATGFRNPNGLGIGPNDEITVADQQGEWVPETRLDLIKPGGFYGYMPMHKRTNAPVEYDPPWCWIPRTADNSAGGQAWVPKDTWGPLQNHLLHLSYGRCRLLQIIPDAAHARTNAGVTTLASGFLSGVMRGRFNPKDGHLYVTGLRGWQTAALHDGCFQRVRYTGKPFNSPTAFRVESDTITLTFDCNLDKEAAEDAGAYSLERWNYKWSSTYGSFDYSLEKPEETHRDKFPIKSVKLLPDGKSLEFKVGDLRPVMQMQLKYQLMAADGTDLPGEFSFTINSM